MSAGLIGASAVAVWFAILDAIQGQLLATPKMLGTSIGTLFLGADVISPAAAFLGYTVLHFAVFMAIGVIVSYVVSSAERTPSVLLGFALLFVIFEVGYVGWTMVLAEGFGSLAWLQVFGANVVAALTMGMYMWRQHPNLPKRLTQELTSPSANA